MNVPNELHVFQKRFLENEALTLTLTGALASHSTIYSVLAEPPERKKLRDTLRKRLPDLAREYSEKQITESQHIQNIETLAEDLTTRFASLLEGRRFRIGIAQKLLNLYLKYCWALGWIPEPPHCPFDEKIIKKLSLEKRINWTEVDSIEDYRKLVESTREKARTLNLSIAQWELKHWQGNPDETTRLADDSSLSHREP